MPTTVMPADTAMMTPRTESPTADPLRQRVTRGVLGGAHRDADDDHGREEGARAGRPAASGWTAGMLSAVNGLDPAVSPRDCIRRTAPAMGNRAPEGLVPTRKTPEARLMTGGTAPGARAPGRHAASRAQRRESDAIEAAEASRR